MFNLTRDLALYINIFAEDPKHFHSKTLAVDPLNKTTGEDLTEDELRRLINDLDVCSIKLKGRLKSMYLARIKLKEEIDLLTEDSQ